MKLLLTFLILLSSVAFAQNIPAPRLVCSFNNGIFRVIDGIQKYERYVGGSVGEVDCGRDYGVLIAGPRYVTYFKGNFQDKYVGGNGARISMLRGHLAVAIMGSYLIVAKAGNQIIDQYIPGSVDPKIELSSSMGVIANGAYLLFTDGLKVVEKYVGNMTNPLLVTGRNVGGALVGNYFVVYSNGSVTDQYVGSRTQNDVIVGGRSELLAASVGSYFIVFDAQRSQFKDTYVGSSGRVEVREDGAYIVSPSGRMTRYNLASGQFESL